MGTRGPVPKRSNQRRRRNKESKPTVVKLAEPRSDPATLAARASKAELLKLAKREGVSVSKAATKAQIAEAIAARALGVAPPADERWHPIALDWYRSLGESGQAQFYEPSDWQAARLVAAELTRYLKAKKKSAMMFSYIWSAMGELLTTEASRRRVKIEIERETAGGDEDGNVADLDAFRKRLAG